MKLLYVIIVGLVFLSCINTKKNISSTAAPAQYQFENVSENDSLFASIRKGACFGQCPVYSMDIYNDGTVIYNGKNFVDKKGKHILKLEYSELLAFVTTAKAINYMQLNDSYDNVSVTDLQSHKTYLFDSQSKLLPNFPVYGNSVIDMVDMDGDKKLELVAKDQENSIIVYKIN